MRDLYSVVGVLSDASYEEIARAASNRSGELIERARLILLDPQRREVYDDAYHAMLVVASIRRTLGISTTRYWSDDDVREWQGKGTTYYPIEVPNSRGANGAPTMFQSLYYLVSPRHRKAALIALIVVVFLFFMWLSD